ncbi:MAG TPA: hypothetical protein VN203_23335 [Candidatus Acidoferrum sp.]|nr:hypothetical protein [Candidatus Acidoferrum sp.]
MACSAEHVTVALGETVTLRAWAETSSNQPPRFAWQVPVGNVKGAGGEVRWDLSSVQPGSYAASVRATANGGTSPECLLRVIIRRDAEARGWPTVPPAPAPSRETGTSWLLPEKEEVPEYGLYSYLLLGSPPTDANRERYVKALAAFWGLIPEIARLEQYIPRRELNIAYLPLRAAPEGTSSPEWLLANYDFARARSLLRFLPGNTREGPYIVSALKPMGTLSSSAPAGPWLFQNLSRVPPHLVASWVKEFLNQAAQERFWEERRTEALAKRLRLTFGILSLGLPEVRKGVDDWIAWIH